MSAARRMPPAEQYWHGCKRTRRFWLVQRSRIAVLRDLAIEAEDIGAALLALAALRATNPWRCPVERHIPLSAAEHDAIERAMRLARKAVGTRGARPSLERARRALRAAR